MKNVLLTAGLLICHVVSLHGQGAFSAAITFEDTVHYFGSVLEGEDVKHTFSFTNTGSADLVLSSVKGSCGCVVPRYPRDPISPGESGAIEVVFHTKLKIGKRRQPVYVLANTKPPLSTIALKGEVRDNKDIERTTFDPVQIILVPDTLTEAHMEAIDCISVYPNPASDWLKFNISERSGQPAEVKVFSKSGRLVERRKVDGGVGSHTLNINLSNYPEGYYIATIQMKGKPLQAKCFVIARD